MAGCLFKRVPSYLVERSLKPTPGFALAEAIWRTQHVIVSEGKARLEFERQSQRRADGDLRLRYFEIELVAISHRAVKRTQAVDKPAQLLVLLVVSRSRSSRASRSRLTVT